MKWSECQDGFSLRAGYNVQIFDDNQGGSKVTITEAQAKDSGWYQCTAYNQSGSTATRARVQVEVPAKDQIVAPSVKLNIPLTGRVIMPEYGSRCVALD